MAVRQYFKNFIGMPTAGLDVTWRVVALDARRVLAEGAENAG